MSKIKKITKNIEYILLSLVVILMTFPIKNVKIPMLFISILWLAFTIINNKKEFINFFIKPNLLTWSIYLWLIFNLVIMIFTKIIPLSFNVFAICLSFMMYLYYNKTSDKKPLYIIVITSLLVFLLVSIITLYNLNFNESISRILSTGNRENYNYFGIGNYSFAYGLVFVILSLFSFFRNKLIVGKKKVFLILYLALLIFCMIKMSFFISLILLILGSVFIILNINNYKKMTFFISISGVLCAILILSGVALSTLNFISKNTDNIHFKIRIDDIAMVLNGEDISQTNDLKLRLSVYEKSLKAFKSSPLVGMVNSKYKTTKLYPGSHSVILDELARYGIIFSIPFFAMMSCIIFKINSSLEKDSRKYWFIIYICALLLSLINTMMFPTLIFMLFTTSPAIIKINELKKQSM